MTDKERAQRQFDQMERIQRNEALEARRQGQDPMDSEWFRQRAKTLEQLATRIGLTATPVASGAKRTYKDLFPEDD